MEGERLESEEARLEREDEIGNFISLSSLSYLLVLSSSSFRQVTMGKGAKIRLEEKDNDSLFRECPVETYPGLAIQSVTDSSR